MYACVCVCECKNYTKLSLLESCEECVKSKHHIQIKVYMCVYVLWLNQVATGDYANIPAYAVGVAAEDM